MLITLLQQTMQKKQLSLRQAAEQIGLSHTTLARILDGQSYDLDTAILVCKWLGVPAAEALGISGADPLVETITTILAMNPPLQGAFQEVVGQIHSSRLEPDVLDEVLQFITFRLYYSLSPSPRDESGRHVPFISDTLNNGL